MYKLHLHTGGERFHVYIRKWKRAKLLDSLAGSGPFSILKLSKNVLWSTQKNWRRLLSHGHDTDKEVLFVSFGLVTKLNDPLPTGNPRDGFVLFPRNDSWGLP